MSKINKIITKIINTPTEKPIEEQAKEILRDCGILDENYNISEGYKDVLVKKDGESDA